MVPPTRTNDHRSDTTDPTPTNPQSEPRRALHAYLTPAAHETWHDFAATNGVSVSALLEALSGPLMSGFDGSTTDVLDAAIVSARATDTARRRRGRNRS